MPDGTNVFRNSRLEEREAKRFEADRQQRREKLFLQVQEEFEKESGQPGLMLSVKSVTLFNPLFRPTPLSANVPLVPYRQSQKFTDERKAKTLEISLKELPVIRWSGLQFYEMT